MTRTFPRQTTITTYLRETVLRCTTVRLAALYDENVMPKQGVMWIGWLNSTTHPQYVNMNIKAKP